jgi:D-alanyl-D-alanine carboxypeptidase/D-alanyl-D-alanine-endopeptidase (penicillin-binding protein 4)
MFISLQIYSQQIDSAFVTLEKEGSLISYSVRDENGLEVKAWQSKLNMQPASTQKVITAAAALYYLGKDFRFSSPVLLDGKLEKGVYQGDIIIQGAGDPEFGRSSGRADSIKNDIILALSNKGIKRINGAIRADVSVYPYNQEAISRYWIYEDIGNYYGTGIYGLNWRGNSFTVEFKATQPGQMADYHFVEYTPYNLPLNSTVSTCIEVEKIIYMWGAPGKSGLDVDGCVPFGQIRRERGALPQPPMQFIRELKTSIEDHFIGSTVSSSIDLSANFNTGDTLISFQSVPLNELIYTMLMQSDNLIAEALLKRIAADLGKDTRAENAVLEVQNYLLAMKFPETSGFHPVDGSGLSPANLMSASFQSAFLHHLINQNDFEIIYNSLPEAGKSGTLKSFETIPGLRAKTGSIKGVRSYMGYIEKDGKKYSFSVMINHITSKDKKLPGDAVSDFLKSLIS